MKLSDYYNFDFAIYPYFNSAYGDHAPQMKYRGEYINGNWYLKYVLEGHSSALVPKESWIGPGRRFLGWIVENDSEFTEYLYSLCVPVISLTEKLEKMNYNDVKAGKIRSRNEFYDEYIRIWSPVIGFGYPLDMALDEYVQSHPIDMHAIPSFGNSFIRQEERDLQKIAREADVQKRNMMLQEHAYAYSYVLSNYTGYHPATLAYFEDRLSLVKDKDLSEEKTLPLHKPKDLMEWIAFATYIRDVRKRCNMIYNAMADRYLKAECKNLGISYVDAVMHKPEEFEVQKKTGLREFHGIRYMEVTNHGQIDLKESIWNSLVTEAHGEEVKGNVASKGRATGTVKIILGSIDFHKMQQGDVLVTSMTRPEFAPILHMCSAIVTNEGGVTCHAAIISREMKVPCVIATGNATKVLKDGDMVEVDAEKGIVRILI